MAEKLFGTSELGEITGMSYRMIYYFIKHGRFPNHQKVGRSAVIPASDVLTFIQEEIPKREQELKDLEKQIKKLKDAREHIESLFEE